MASRTLRSSPLHRGLSSQRAGCWGESRQGTQTGAVGSLPWSLIYVMEEGMEGGFPLARSPSGSDG